MSGYRLSVVSVGLIDGWVSRGEIGFMQNSVGWM